jgi:hypothetical protein
MPPDLISASAKWKVPQNRLPKTPQDAFSVGARYHALGNPAAISGIELVQAVTPACCLLPVIDLSEWMFRYH